MLTDMDDLLFDPFGGSCVTGEVSEKLRRRWVCCEVVEEYIEGAKGRFEINYQSNYDNLVAPQNSVEQI
jgi:site-specific DNA-methyltransferase (cytosine-N4-specific)